MANNFAHPEFIVESHWLADRLNDPTVRVLDCTTHRKRVALPPRIFRIMLAHSLALTSEDKRGERRSEVGILDEAG